MAKYTDTCPECGREFTNYHGTPGNRLRCSVGCDADAAMTTEPRRHTLKCWSEYYDAIERGDKTFEARLNDRDYQVGDVLELVRWDKDNGRPTGEAMARIVTYVLHGPGFGIEDGWCVMALRKALGGGNG